MVLSTTIPRKTLLSLGSLPPKPTSALELTKGLVFTPSRVNPNQPPWPAFRGYHTFSFAK